MARTSPPARDTTVGETIGGGTSVGATVGEIVRVGSTVRRPMPPNADYVHALLDLFARYAWPSAPRLRGTDPQGRQVLEYLPGHVACEPWQPPAVWSEASLARVARLTRQFHDLTVGTRLAGDAEVVCHNDLAPRHTVYRDDGEGLRPYAFLDWDRAAPGRRIEDLAYVCWRFLDLGPGRSDVEGPGRLMRLMCEAYALPIRDRAELVPTVLSCQERCLQGDERIVQAYDWTAANAHRLHAIVTERRLT